MNNPPARIKAGNLLLAWVVSSLGFPFGGVLALSLAGPMDDAVSAALGGLLAGAVVGAAQWTLLRERLRYAGAWVPTLAVAWPLGCG